MDSRGEPTKRNAVWEFKRSVPIQESPVNEVTGATTLDPAINSYNHDNRSCGLKERHVPGMPWPLGKPGFRFLDVDPTEEQPPVRNREGFYSSGGIWSKDVMYTVPDDIHGHEAITMSALHARRYKKALETHLDRLGTLTNPNWTKDDERSVQALFDRLRVKPGAERNLTATFLYGHNDPILMKWMQGLLTRNRGFSIHEPCELDLLNVWSIERPEDMCFRSELVNKMIVFHGTHRDDVFELMYNGFKSPRARASKKGVFQNAIYFQTCSTKAANFCVENAYDYERKADRQEVKPRDGEIIYIIVCTVAFGVMAQYEEFTTKSVSKHLWEGRHGLQMLGMCKHSGRMLPTEGGSVMIPLGPFDPLPKDYSKALRTRQVYDDLCVKDHCQIKVTHLCEIAYKRVGSIIPFKFST